MSRRRLARSPPSAGTHPRITGSTIKKPLPGRDHTETLCTSGFNHHYQKRVVKSFGRRHSCRYQRCLRLLGRSYPMPESYGRMARRSLGRCLARPAPTAGTRTARAAERSRRDQHEAEAGQRRLARTRTHIALQRQRSRPALRLDATTLV